MIEYIRRNPKVLLDGAAFGMFLILCISIKQEGLPPQQFCYPAFEISLAVSLAAMCAPRAVRSVSSWGASRFLAAFAILAAVSATVTALPLFVELDPALTPWRTAIAGIFKGVACSLLIPYWIGILIRMGDDSYRLLVVGMVFSAVFLVALSFVPRHPGEVFFLFALIAVAAVTAVLRRGQGRLLDVSSRLGMPYSSYAKGKLAATLLIVASFGFAVGIVCYSDLLHRSVSHVNPLVGMGLLLAALAMPLYWKHLRAGVNRISYLIAASTLLLVDIMFMSTSMPATAVAYPVLADALLGIVTVFVFAYSYCFYFQTNASPLILALVVTAVLHLGAFVGWLVSALLGGDVVVVAMLVAFNLLSVACVMILARQTPAETSDYVAEDGGDHSACAFLAELCGFSDREVEVTDLVTRGYSVNAIAEGLGISPNTVRAHMKSIYQKAGVHKKQELIDYVERNTR
jgi:DNA-binding CsgD family transcriptional regulator